MKRNIVIATVAAAALIGGGTAAAFATGDDEAPAAAKSQDGRSVTNIGQNDDRDDSRDDHGDRDDRDDRDDSRDDRDDAAAVRDAKVTAAQAIDAALKAQPGTAVSADLDLYDGDDDRGDDRGWEVDILGQGTTSYTVHVDPSSGKVLGKETEDDGDDADDIREQRAALKGAQVDAEQAAEAASVKGFVTSVDLDDDEDAKDRGWDVETADGKNKGHDRDWNVDLKTAKVTQDQDDDRYDG
ncbi:PepSY domain-containing protein [Streptomyces monticola]|uniref:PepSY domain-containing protein n=1 Tax=Streptomyces monticola TaxID=2666263 RepID=A0ABW2JXE7_9ACTN